MRPERRRKQDENSNGGGERGANRKGKEKTGRGGNEDKKSDLEGCGKKKQDRRKERVEKRKGKGKVCKIGRQNKDELRDRE